MKLSRSVIVFFGTEVTEAILKDAVTIPEPKESLTILNTTVPTQVKHALSKHVGTGSTMEVAALISELLCPEK